MPAPTATSVCCAQAKVRNRRTAHADRTSANFLKYSPLVSSFKLLGCGRARLVVSGEAGANGPRWQKEFGGRNRLSRNPVRDRQQNHEGLVWPNCVSDRGSYTNDVAGGKVGRIVEDLVVADLWTDEDVTPDVVAETRSQVDQEMVRTLVALPKLKAAKSVNDSVEPRALPADAAHQVRTYLFGELRLIHAIEVKQDWAEGLTAGAAVLALACLPCSVKAEAYAPVKDHVGTKIYIQASFFRAKDVACGGARGCAGRHDCTEAEHGVRLLGRSEVSKNKKREDGRNEGKLSQEEPPVRIIDGDVMQAPNHLDASAWANSHHSFNSSEFQFAHTRFSPVGQNQQNETL